MDISPETLKIILIIISAIVAIIVSVASFYVITYIKKQQGEKLKSERRAALNAHRINANNYALSTYINGGFDANKYNVKFKQRLEELIREDELFQD